uniref:Uncharacterized protein n=1 Tax=Anguilla anguilla TaxID=7936 RepID=A0A0E9UQ95_ANGAN
MRPSVRATHPPRRTLLSLITLQTLNPITTLYRGYF